jgi:flagellar basal body rod protein FlgG
MSGTAYVALSGLRVRMQHLDRVAADIANASTPGYKSERFGDRAVERQSFGDVLKSAVDVTTSASRIDFTSGEVLPTGRDLDFAVDGNAFMVVRTPGGPRYMKGGQFTRSADGTLATAEGYPVLGDDDRPIEIAAGPVTVQPDGTILNGKKPAGKVHLVTFANEQVLQREGTGRYRAPAGIAPAAATKASLHGGVLEQSNVSVPERLAELTQVSRGFEALQRGITVAMDIDGRAIAELGRR